MRITATRQQWTDALNAVAHATAARSTLPILQHFLFDAPSDGTFRILGTDLEIGIVASPTVTVDEPGMLAIPAKMLLNALKTIDRDEHIIISSTAHGQAKIEAGTVTYDIFGLPGEEFPVAERMEVTDSFTIPASVLRQAVTLTQGSAATDISKGIMQGICFERIDRALTIAATDTHRLSVYTCDVTPESDTITTNVVATARIMTEILRITPTDNTPILCECSHNSLRFTVGTMTLRGRLMEGVYPAYRRIIPDDGSMPGFFAVDRKAFIAALERSSIVASAESNKVVFTLTPTTLKLHAETATVGKFDEDVPIELTASDYVKDGHMVAFNVEYLLDGLKGIVSNTVVMFLGDKLNAPGLLTVPDVPNYRYIVMPIAL